MAALSRPSLRSSARKHPELGLSATDADALEKRLERTQNKRTRDASLDNESNASSKRLKNSPQEPSRPLTGPLKDAVAKSLPFRDKQRTSSKDAVTQPVRRSRRAPVVAEEVAFNTKSDLKPQTQTFPRKNNVNGSDHLNVVPSTQHTASQPDKRSLRSHDGGSRSKSELSLYFPNYDDLISIEPRLRDALTPETVLFVTDEPTRPTVPSSQKSDVQKRGIRSPSEIALLSDALQIVDYPAELFTTLTDAVRIDFSKQELRAPGRASKRDPLDDEIFLKVHRRMERQEKQLRNIEKERAMHEKVQLDRLLDGLKGPDWLRVMGISGITDGEKKAYEPKRDHLIREVKILLEKFRLWKEEEKRRKVEKEEEEDEDGDEEEEEGSEEGDDADEEDEEEDPEEMDDEQDQKGKHHEFGHPFRFESPPNDSDVDASAARQLHLEATRASQLSQLSFHPFNSPFASNARPVKSSRRRRPRARASSSGSPDPRLHDTASLTTAGAGRKKHPPPPGYHLSQAIPPPLPSIAAIVKPMKQAQITSFFSKPYLRDAAIGQHRRSGRSTFAFGQPLPEIEERGFRLPSDILTEEAVRKAERKGRADKRGRKE